MTKFEWICEFCWEKNILKQVVRGMWDEAEVKDFPSVSKLLKGQKINGLLIKYIMLQSYPLAHFACPYLCTLDHQLSKMLIAKLSIP